VVLALRYALGLDLGVCGLGLDPCGLVDVTGVLTAVVMLTVYLLYIVR